MPLLIGALMDRGAYLGVWLVLAALQATMIVSAFGVGRSRAAATVPG
jgi:hypothetical protein